MRSFVNLDTYLFSDPKTPSEKNHNKEAVTFAEYVQGKFDFKNTTKSKRTFLAFFEELTEEKQRQDSSNNYGNWFS